MRFCLGPTGAPASLLGQMLEPLERVLGHFREHPTAPLPPLALGNPSFCTVMNGSDLCNE